jgi:hypothetical protein
VACEYCERRGVSIVSAQSEGMEGGRGGGGYRGKSRLSRRTCFRLRRRLCPVLEVMSASASVSSDVYQVWVWGMERAKWEEARSSGGGKATLIAT